MSTTVRVFALVSLASLLSGGCGDPPGDASETGTAETSSETDSDGDETGADLCDPVGGLGYEADLSCRAAAGVDSPVGLVVTTIVDGLECPTNWNASAIKVGGVDGLYVELLAVDRQLRDIQGALVSGGLFPDVHPSYEGIVGDFDGDGADDIVFALISLESHTDESGRLFVSWGSSAGDFSTPELFDVPQVEGRQYLRTAIRSSVDGLLATSSDNTLDPVMVRFPSRALAVEPVGLTSIDDAQIVVGDFDGDARGDIAQVNPQGVRLHPQAADGSYPEFVDLLATTPWNEPSLMVANSPGQGSAQLILQDYLGNQGPGWRRLAYSQGELTEGTFYFGEFVAGAWLDANDDSSNDLLFAHRVGYDRNGGVEGPITTGILLGASDGTLSSWGTVATNSPNEFLGIVFTPVVGPTGAPLVFSGWGPTRIEFDAACE